ncbi:MAG: hypothetical protein ACRD2B_14695 [Terriglobia bacterium]
MFKNQDDSAQSRGPSGRRGLQGAEEIKGISRRELLKYSSSALAGGLVSSTLGKCWAAEPRFENYPSTDSSTPEEVSGKTPISLIIDDGSPVDIMFYTRPGYETPFLVPVKFYQGVADAMERFDLHGKMTVLPMPVCLGRIDQSLKRVPQQHLQSYLKIVRERIAPRFDITPEFLTHFEAYNLKSGKYEHVLEDVWISGAPIGEVVEYFDVAFTIHKNVGLSPTGITSPWSAGIDVEKKYAQALSEAQWNAFGRKLTWYFLYVTGWGQPRRLAVTYESRDRFVVSVPANFPDIFWSMNLPRDQRQRFISDNIDRVISADGRSGRIRQLIETGYPVILLTHWQSLYTQGTELGLHALDTLMERIRKVFGSSLEWVTCSERARRYVASSKLSACVATSDEGQQISL